VASRFSRGNRLACLILAQSHVCQPSVPRLLVCIHCTTSTFRTYNASFRGFIRDVVRRSHHVLYSVDSPFEFHSKQPINYANSTEPMLFCVMAKQSKVLVLVLLLCLSQSFGLIGYYLTTGQCRKSRISSLGDLCLLAKKKK
jgi:hypothetical protein